jgi:hypothetical protein
MWVFAALMMLGEGVLVSVRPAMTYYFFSSKLIPRFDSFILYLKDHVETSSII